MGVGVCMLRCVCRDTYPESSSSSASVAVAEEAEPRPPLAPVLRRRPELPLRALFPGVAVLLAAGVANTPCGAWGGGGAMEEDEEEEDEEEEEEVEDGGGALYAS